MRARERYPAQQSGALTVGPVEPLILFSKSPLYSPIPMNRRNFVSRLGQGMVGAMILP